MLLADDGGTYACIKVALSAANKTGCSPLQKNASPLAYAPQGATVNSEGTHPKGFHIPAGKGRADITTKRKNKQSEHMPALFIHSLYFLLWRVFKRLICLLAFSLANSS